MPTAVCRQGIAITPGAFSVPSTPTARLAPCRPAGDDGLNHEEPWILKRIQWFFLRLNHQTWKLHGKLGFSWILNGLSSRIEHFTQDIKHINIAIQPRRVR